MFCHFALDFLSIISYAHWEILNNWKPFTLIFTRVFLVLFSHPEDILNIVFRVFLGYNFNSNEPEV